jgi:hypothetical protein
MTANHLCTLAPFPLDLVAATARRFSYNSVRDTKRGYASPLKIFRVSKPLHGRGSGDVSSVSVGRFDYARLFLTSKGGSERDVAAAVKRAASILKQHDGREPFSQVVVIKAFYLLRAGWTNDLYGSDCEDAEFAAEQNQAQEVL